MYRLILLYLLALFPVAGMATCWEQAGARYNIEPELLRAIAIIESNNNPQAINKNHNGNVDVGLMQVNSQHFASLSQFRISQKDLLTNPCQSVMVGAWILAGMVQQFGYTWDAVGAYNAGTANTPKHRARRHHYIAKVAPQYFRLKNTRLSP